MPIKGWKKISELKYRSIIQPQQYIQITKNHLHLPLYEGWGMIWWTGYRVEVLCPYNFKARGSWIELSKKDAIQWARNWMRKHPRGG